MKYYETQFDDYVVAADKYNLHPELSEIHERLPVSLENLENLIVYGPSGVGKYTQVLRLLSRYSPMKLKYEKKMVIQNEKHQYTYHISDIHYEIDMGLLGCNSKFFWHEFFSQVVDIITMKPQKIGVILCKNFHCIHTELLEIFYSYMQQYSNHSLIKLKFILLTEHVSFLPNSIINVCGIISVRRPSKTAYLGLTETPELLRDAFENVDLETIMNVKEIFSMKYLKEDEETPKDIFNIICDQIIVEIMNASKLNYTGFRDTIYDILIYNLDITECLWYILSHFCRERILDSGDISDILKRSYTFLKYYNNNYRPIYHLESIFFYFIIKIHGWCELPECDELSKSHSNSRNR